MVREEVLSVDWYAEYPTMIEQGFTMETYDDGETWWVKDENQ